MIAMMDNNRPKKKLFTSELRVMNVLWKNGNMTAKAISDVLKEKVGWNINTTYTVIKKCIAKGAVERTEPNFMCHSIVTKDAVQKAECEELVEKLFDGRPELLVATLISSCELSKEQKDSLREMINNLED